ncbi:MAG TPA: hypothetical protein VM011_01185 [Gammaproteobacteria bacterium]|nr:hypothetical protein [Gammaproteobacteria bacterium]
MIADEIRSYKTGWISSVDFLVRPVVVREAGSHSRAPAYTLYIVSISASQNSIAFTTLYIWRGIGRRGKVVALFFLPRLVRAGLRQPPGPIRKTKEFM